MLDVDAENLVKLIRVSETKRDQKLDALHQREQMAMGALAGPMVDDMETPENLGFQLYSMLVPQMVTSSPQVDIATSGGYLENVRARAISATVNQIFQTQRIENALAPCAWDYFFKTHACAFVESADALMGDLTENERSVLKGRMARPMPSDSEPRKAPRGNETPIPMAPAMWPRVKWLDPRACGYDMTQGSFSEARFTFHKVRIDQASLLKRASEHGDDWYADAVGRMATCNEVALGSGRQAKNGDNRFVEYYVVYVAGRTIEGETPGPENPGVIYTLAHTSASARANDHSGGVQIRRPYYYTGHPAGPHVFKGQYLTGADSGFLSLLGASESALSMLESVSASIHQRVRDHKQVHVFDSAAEEDARRVQNAQHGDFVGVAGMRDGSGVIQTIETDSLTPSEVQNLALMQQNAGRQVGADDAALGFAAGDATATEVKIASSGTKTRVDFILNGWHSFVRDIAERCAFDVAHNEQVVARLGQSGREGVLRAQLEPLAQQGRLSFEGVEAVIEDQKRTPMLIQGGDFKTNEEFDWYSLQLIVRPTSTEGAYGDRALAREQVWNNTLAQLGGLMVQQPHIRWIDRIKATGRALGMSDAEMSVDIEKAQEVAQMMLAQAQPDPGTSSTMAVKDEGPSTPRTNNLPPAAA